VAFPPREATAAAARQLWRFRLAQLAALGWGPVRSQYAMGRALACPWGLLGLGERGDEDARPCHLAGCPSCHALGSALLTETVLRAIDAHPAVELRLHLERFTGPQDRVARFLDRPRDADPGAAGRVRQFTAWRARPHGYCALVATLTAGAGAGTPVPRNPLGVARAVSWMRPYPAEDLLDEGDPLGVSLLNSLRQRAGQKLASRRGIFRSPLAVLRLSQCGFVAAPCLDPSKVPNRPERGPGDDLACEMTDGEITSAVTVPDPPAGDRQDLLAGLLQAHILDASDPETGDLVIPLPPDLDDEEFDDWILPVRQSDAGEFWEDWHADELLDELREARDPAPVALEDPEHRAITEALATLRAGRRHDSYRGARGAALFAVRVENSGARGGSPQEHAATDSASAGRGDSHRLNPARQLPAGMWGLMRRDTSLPTAGLSALL